MAKIVWDELGKRLYETGTSKAVLYPQKADGSYKNGVAWSGLTAVTESPSGAEETALYADNIKYLSLRSAEEFGFTIEAYSYPDEWAECDGSAKIGEAVTIGQQNRSSFGFVYSSIIGNDTEKNDYGEKIHLIYNATAAPSERSYATVNDSPEAITFSWEVKTIPVNIPGFKPTAMITIDTTKLSKEEIKKLTDKLYGTEDTEPTLPSPSDLVALLGISAG